MPAALRDADVRHHEDILLDDRFDEHVVHLPIADQVGEAVDAGRQELLRVVVIEDVCDHVEAVTMRLVDDWAVEVRLELLDGTAAVVDPDLDERHAPGRELLYVPPSLLLTGDPVGGRP